MTAHVSSLVLDELAADLPVAAEAKAHVDGCSECTARLQSLAAARSASAASFGHARTRARLVAPPEVAWWKRWLWVAPLVAGLIGFLVFQGLGDDSRLKGTAWVELIDASGTAVTRAHVGDRLKLRIGAAGFNHALVTAVGDDGASSRVWPESEGSDQLPGGGVVTLRRELEVTEGSLTVEVVLSKAPIDAAHPGAGATASVRLEVSP